ncbi:MAG: outer membrane lipoprotein carrier protein LolA [Spirochaetota bacterium]
MRTKSFVVVVGVAMFFPANPAFSQDHNWNSPSEVVKKIRKKFVNLKAYTANFHITTTTGIRRKSTKNLKGKCTYKKPGMIRYQFSQPAGDLIVSNGKTLWIYIKRKDVVGKQDLTLKKKKKSGKPIFQVSSSAGLNRLFRKYHYKFNSTKQPQKGKDGKSYFVLALEQREKIGGFEHMTLYVDAKTYLIHKTIAKDSLGNKTTLEFSNMRLNPDIEDGIFKYQISGSSKIVNNPLVSDNQ